MSDSIVSFATTRRVWREVTKAPNASVQTLAGRSSCSTLAAWLALRELRRLGYIAFDDRTRSTRRVLVPFVVTRKQVA